MRKILIVLVAVLFLAPAALFALDQAKVDARREVIAGWGKDPELVAAVKALNAAPPAEGQGMTQTDWEKLMIVDPRIKGLQANKVGAFLKNKKEGWVAEAIVSLADGTKAGFITKTSGWSHKGKAKHDKPMAGETWQGEIELDKSTGKEQLQVAVPVMDGGTAIGSLVVGIDLSRL